MTSCDCGPCDYYEERAAIREHDGKQPLRQAEREALTETVNKFGRDSLEHMQAVGTIAEQRQLELAATTPRQGR